MIPSAENSAPGGKAFPSYVAYSKDWKLLVGEPARKQAAINPGGTKKKVKRDMGTGKTVRFCPDGQNETREYTPEAVSAEILRKVKEDAEAYLGDTVDKVIITVPAYFNDNQRKATIEAGRAIGVEVLKLVNEPTAAAISYGFNEAGKSQKILVFDMGGGTLDVTIMDAFEGVFDVNSTSGNTELGGTDMDMAISDFLINEFRKNTGVDLSGNPKAKMRIDEASEEAKKELSTLEEVSIEIPFIAAKGDELLHLQRTLKRSELESIVGPKVQECHKTIDDALSSVGLKAADIDSVLLVGGPTRMPIIKNFVKEKLGDKIAGGIDPMECVCFGAALLAAKEDGTLPSDANWKGFNDVTPLPLGVGLVGSVFSVIIEKNSTVPARNKVDGYTTIRDNQTGITFPVFQGEGKLITDPGFVRLGELVISGLAMAPEGVPQVSVQFEIDSSGMIFATATDMSNGREAHAEIKSSAWTSAEEMVMMAERK
jgi:Molecular chaperone